MTESVAKQIEAGAAHIDSPKGRAQFKAGAEFGIDVVLAVLRQAGEAYDGDRRQGTKAELAADIIGGVTKAVSG